LGEHLQQCGKQDKQTNTQTNKQANNAIHKQTSKHINKQTNTNNQANKQNADTYKAEHYSKKAQS